MPQQHRGRRATHPIHAGNPAGAGEQIGGREAVPPYGEPRVLPTAALEADLQRRLAAELEAAGQPGTIAPAIESEGCCRDDHGQPITFQKSRRVAATLFRWILRTDPRQHGGAANGDFGLSGRSPWGSLRPVHNCE